MRDQSEKKVFLVDVEYAYSTGHDDSGALEGGFVDAFVSAGDVREAVHAVENALGSLSLEPLVFNAAYVYEGASGLDAETEEWYTALAQRARRSGSVEFSDFYAYQSREEG